MWVLALDTTSRDGSVALVRDDVVVLARPGDAAVSHAERIPADLRAILADAGLTLHDVDVFAVATGPGPGVTDVSIGAPISRSKAALGTRSCPPTRMTPKPSPPPVARSRRASS